MRSWLQRRDGPFIALWLVGLALIAWAGTRVDSYLLHVRQVPLPHPYPWEEVGTMAAVVTVEVILFYAVIRPRSYERSWPRALAAFLVGLVLLVYFGAALLHAPPAMEWHWRWLAGATSGLLVTLGVTVARNLTARAADGSRVPE